MTFKRFSIGLVLGLITILFIGIGYEQYMRHNTHLKFKPIGNMTAIGNIQLHTITKGQKNSNPTVVFVAGYYPTGASSLIWKNIQNKISKHTKTISYDRSGLLWSDFDNEVSVEKTIANLHQLLIKLDGTGPYILVGHSIAGLSIQAFAAKYPEMIKGLVLIDASVPDQATRIPKEILGNQNLPNSSWSSFLGAIGYLRITHNYQYRGTKSSDSINLISNAFFPEKAVGIIKSKGLKTKWMKKVEAQGQLGDLPIKIITAAGEKIISEFASREQGIKFNTIWIELQQEMLSLSTNTEIEFAKQSGHYIPLEEPELVVNTILKLLKELEKE